ncbi:MAG: anaerobic ribonucleoside-triphosphate reductase activating protein [Lachnospiraceae bacterium]
MKYHNITKDDMLNGSGLRVVLWVSGCTHHCPECHNPVTWDPEDGLEFDDAAKAEIFQQLDQPYISGLTFSGGDPLHPNNRDAVYELAKEVKERYPDKNIWLYTGFEWDKIRDLPVIPYLDILIDGRFVKELYDPKLNWVGSSNQKIIDVPMTLELGRIVLYQ